ncbi:MAG: hypothetical protein ABJL55_09830, partial [Roseibium sp.]
GSGFCCRGVGASSAEDEGAARSGAALGGGGCDGAFPGGGGIGSGSGGGSHFLGWIIARSPGNEVCPEGLQDQALLEISIKDIV